MESRSFPYKNTEVKKGHPIFSPLCDLILEMLAKAVRQKEEI